MIPYFHVLFIQRHGMISALMIYGLFEKLKRKVFEFVELLPYKQYLCRSGFSDRHFLNFSPYLETDGEKHS